MVKKIVAWLKDNILTDPTEGLSKLMPEEKSTRPKLPRDIVEMARTGDEEVPRIRGLKRPRESLTSSSQKEPKELKVKKAKGSVASPHIQLKLKALQILQEDMTMVNACL